MGWATVDTHDQSCTLRDSMHPTDECLIPVYNTLIGHPLDDKTYVAGRPPPPLVDERDRVLQEHVFVPCLRGNGLLVGGKDTRPHGREDGEPKYVCDVHQLGKDKPCVVYSFGSYNEIMFEVGIKALAPQCVQFEFHRVDMLKRFTASLVGRGFRLIHARVNDRCGTCTEVAFQFNSTP